MTEHQMIGGLVIALFSFLLGVIWLQLNARIRKVEEWKVDKGFCKTKQQLLDEKFHGISARIGDMRDINARDHERLDDQLIHMRAALEEIRDCMVKLASQKECN